MTAKEKVLWSALDRLRKNAQYIFDKRTVRDWAETLAEADSALKATKDAAASLPAEVEDDEGKIVTLCEEHGFRDCSVCFHDEPLLPSPGNDGFQEWLNANTEGMEGEDDAETLMHVAWRAALLKSKEKTC